MAAQSPASEPMASDAMPVTIMQQGSSMMPSFFSGFVSSETRCRSHFVIVMQAAKPMDEQIEMMRDDVVIDLSNCLKAAIGSSEMQHMARPATSRTRRVSMRFTSA